MGTCCLVGLLNENQTVDFISVHYDGDTSYTGIRLLECVDTAEEVREILSLGNMRSLGWLTDDEKLPAPYKDSPAKTVSLDEYLNTIIDVGIEYLYLFDPSKGWQVASYYNPVNRQLYKETDVMLDYFDYETQQNLLNNSILGQARKKLYPLAAFTEYEFRATLRYFYSKGDREYSEYYTELKQKCFEEGIITEDDLTQADIIEQEGKQVRAEGLKQLQAECDKVYNEQQERGKKNYQLIRANTTDYDRKETRKAIKRALSTAGYKNISVTSNTYSIHFCSNEYYTAEEAEEIKQIINSFKEESKRYKQALEMREMESFVPESHYNNYYDISFFTPMIKESSLVC